MAVRTVALVAVALLASACRVDLVFDVVVADDGSGRVELVVRADPDVMAHVDLDAVDLGGLGTGGWELSGPVTGADGTSISLTKRVPSAGQFDDVVAQLDEGRLVRDVALDIDVGLGTATYEFTATLDPTMRARDFSDSRLIELLDGEPFGERTEVLEERAGRPLDETVVVTVRVQMPDGSMAEASRTLADDEPAVVYADAAFADDGVEARRELARAARDTFDDSVRTVAVFWGIAAVLALVLLSIGWRRRRAELRRSSR